MSGVATSRTQGGWLMPIWVQPGSGRSAVVGAYGNAVKVAVSAPPEKGRANRALCKVLAEALGCRVADVRVVRGETSRRKDVVVNASAADMERFLKQVNESKGR